MNDLSHTPKAPKTEGVKYTGSKLKLIPFILQMTNGLQVKSVLDAFSGTTRVSQAFAQQGYDTHANDIAAWSEVFGQCYLMAGKEASYYQGLIDHLNTLPGRDGWFSEHYGGREEDCKKPFQLKNTRKADAIRDEIDRLGLQWEDKCVLLTSLMLALDAVDSTLGHYAAYLSKWSQRSYHELHLRLPRKFRIKTENHVTCMDAFDAVKDYHDLAYLDPPYGSNNEKMPPSRVRYAAYYHIWKTLVLNDRPQLFGKAGRREDSKDAVAASVFEEFRRDTDGGFVAMKAIDRLIGSVNARYVLLSYSSGGRATKEELFGIINRHGRLREVREIDYRRNVMASCTWTNDWINSAGQHKEYLFLMEK